MRRQRDAVHPAAGRLGHPVEGRPGPPGGHPDCSTSRWTAHSRPHDAVFRGGKSTHEPPKAIESLPLYCSSSLARRSHVASSLADFRERLSDNLAHESLLPLTGFEFVPPPRQVVRIPGSWAGIVSQAGSACFKALPQRISPVTLVAPLANLGHDLFRFWGSTASACPAPGAR